MKKLKKILLGIGIGLVALIVIMVIIVSFFLGSIVKTGIETVGPEIAKVSVKLDGVHLSLLTGSAKIKGLVIGNPEGYKTPHAISVGSAAVGVNSLSVLSDKIVVRSVRVEAPEITFEGNPFGGNNLGKIMDNVNAATKSSAAPSTNAPVRAGKKPARKYEVDDFLITGAKVHVSLTGMGGKEMTLPLPPIHLTDLGKGNEGLTATDLTRRVLDAITTATLKAVSSAATDIGKSAGKLGKETGKAVGKGANKITKGIGDLFGK
ncbi:MAG: AsmA family protein [Verrucomicrobiota bacterium]|jgi:uncharacterized protein involved in outer membrane biogenesis